MPAEPDDAKILPLDDLPARLDTLRDTRTLVHCHGVFDLQHIGHVRYLQAARRLGGDNACLIVTLTPDHLVNKGPDRPAFTAELRAAQLAALACVDFVAVNRWPTAVPTIQALRPHIFAKGSEFRDESVDATGAITAEREAVEAVGGRLALTDEIVFSSSALLNSHVKPEAEAVRAYLAGYVQRHGTTAHRTAVRDAAGLDVLAIGDAAAQRHQPVRLWPDGGVRPAGPPVDQLPPAEALCTELRPLVSSARTLPLADDARPLRTRYIDADSGVEHFHLATDVGTGVQAAVPPAPVTLLLPGAAGRITAAAQAALEASPACLGLLLGRDPAAAARALLTTGRADCAVADTATLRGLAGRPRQTTENLAEDLAARLTARLVVLIETPTLLVLHDTAAGPLRIDLPERQTDEAATRMHLNSEENPARLLAMAAALLAAGAPGEVAVWLAGVAANAPAPTPSAPRYLDPTRLIRHADTLLK